MEDSGTSEDRLPRCHQSEICDVEGTKRRLQLQGGYECIFVDELPQHLQTECSVCLSVLRDPQLIDCDCGSSFCRDCIDPIKAEGKLCPLCNGMFTTSIPDRRLQRTLNSLKVYCTYKDTGCGWIGDLGKLTDHFAAPLSSVSSAKGGCYFVPNECSFCQQKLERRFIDEHKSKQCLKRPFCCEDCNDYKSTFEDVTTKHVLVCPSRPVSCPNECGVHPKREDLRKHLAEFCPLELIDCSFRFAGCEEKIHRKDILTHINENLAVHMSLQGLQVLKHHQMIEDLQARISNLEKENDALKEQQRVCMHLRVAPLHIMMDGFTLKKESGIGWDSEPFYTHLQGYKMCLNVEAGGDGDGRGTHVSVYLVLLRGEFDDQLEWPFKGSVTVVLLDQEGDDHVVPEDLFAEDANEEYTTQVINEEKNNGWGSPRFISHDSLHPKHLKSDSLLFKVIYFSNKT